VIEQITKRVAASRRYRDVDGELVRRFAREEASGARNLDEAVKRVKRRLHQAVGAFEGRRRVLDEVRAAYDGSLDAPAFRDACRAAMAAHASTAERAGDLEALGALVAATNARTVVDLGCGLGPLALPWMEFGPAGYVATDVDQRPLTTARAFLELVGQAHEVVVADPASPAADLALLLKLVTTLDRQDATAAERVVRGLRTRTAIVSFPMRSLGRRRGLADANRRRMDELLQALGGRVEEAREASVSDELVYVLTLARG
jgi:16S rRNA (guanine(1405)-N(7))-methyltransferase